MAPVSLRQHLLWCHLARALRACRLNCCTLPVAPLSMQQPCRVSLQGGIYFNQGSMPLLRVTLRNNTAVRNGGGILQTSFQGDITSATFTANRAGTRQAVLLLSWLAGPLACGCRVQLQKPAVCRLVLNANRLLQLKFAWASEVAEFQSMHHFSCTQAALLHCPFHQALHSPLLLNFAKAAGAVGL